MVDLKVRLDGMYGVFIYKYIYMSGWIFICIYLCREVCVYVCVCGFYIRKNTRRKLQDCNCIKLEFYTGSVLV